MNKYSRFATQGEDNSILDTSTIFNQVIADGFFDSSGCKRNIEGNLKLLNYGRYAIVKVLDNGALFLGQFGNPTSITFDPYWEYSQIGSYLAKDFGRNYTANKIGSIGYKLSPLELSTYITKNSYNQIIFGGGDLSANADYTLDFLTAFARRGEKTKPLEVTLYTNGFLSQSLIDELEKVGNSRSMEITIRVWFYSVDNDFWIKHTKRNIRDFYKSLDFLQESDLQFEFALLFIPDENDSPAQIDRLSTRILSYYGDNPATNSLEVYRFYPAYRIMDKKSHTDSQFETITKQLADNTQCNISIIDKPSS